MKKDIKQSIFIFRRDLRLRDNTALIAALKSYERVIPIFIFDPAQVGNNNEFKSNNCIQFMLESLDSLDKELREKGSQIYFFYGEPSSIVQKIIKEKSVSAVFVNRDYTPFSIKRDESIESVCKTNKIDFYLFDDVLLNAPNDVLTSNGEPYSVFTAYYKKAILNLVNKPVQNKYDNYFKGDISFAGNKADLFKKVLNSENRYLWVHGGKEAYEKIIKKLKILENYKETRDIPSLNTTNLSAYIKFGIASIREVFYAIEKKLGQDHPLLKQFYWHDFYTVVAYFSPNVYGAPFRKEYSKLKWSSNEKHFEAWKNGKTGFPIVDAGMRQLNKTGYMHNRVRMIVASFLVKDLHINWLKGEKYFAQNLVDYDPALNNGNWQWSASTGCDAQPYFRIFNPWLQQKKFDSDCKYIKTWVPELKKVDAKKIHNWEFYCENFDIDYPCPIVDHKKAAQEVKKMFKAAK